MEIRQNTRDGVTVLRPVVDQLDIVTCRALKDVLSEQAASGGAFLVMDLRDVQFMDSTGLAVLISGLRALDGSGEIAICNATQPVLDLLRITGLTRIFPLFDSEEEARRSYLGRAV